MGTNPSMTPTTHDTGSSMSVVGANSRTAYVHPLCGSRCITRWLPCSAVWALSAPSMSALPTPSTTSVATITGQIGLRANPSRAIPASTDDATRVRPMPRRRVIGPVSALARK